MQTPVGRPADTIRVERLDDELSVFDTSTGTAVALNHTAADILALADGTSTIDDVTHVLARTYGVEAASIADDVRAAVQQLRDANLLVTDD